MALTNMTLYQGLRGGLFLACSLAAAAVWAAAVITHSTSYTALGVEAGQLIATDAAGSQVRIVRRDGKLESLPRERSTFDNRPADILPDGVVASGTGDIRRAWLGGPTRRYDHAVLGDDLEASRLIVVDRDGRRHVVELPSHQVFEDRYPRLVDLDDDGASEIVLIRSDTRRGAATTLYALRDGGLTERAASQPIGLSHRWLNVAGTADFDDDGQKEIAVVVTPHIGGTLTLLRRQGDALIPVARQPGFSNHAYGSRELGMSAVLDYNGDGVADLAVPDARRESVVVASFAGGAYRQLDRISHDAPVTSAIQVVDIDDDGEDELAYLLADGTLVLAGRD